MLIVKVGARMRVWILQLAATIRSSRTNTWIDIELSLGTGCAAIRRLWSAARRNLYVAAAAALARNPDVRRCGRFENEENDFVCRVRFGFSNTNTGRARVVGGETTGTMPWTATSFVFINFFFPSPQCSDRRGSRTVQRMFTGNDCRRHASVRRRREQRFAELDRTPRSSVHVAHPENR
jgi:hypothetical protein